MRALLVEDDQQLGQALTRALEQESMEMEWVRTLQDGDLALRTRSFDLVLLDLTLPDGDGLQLLQQLRRRDDRTPLLILTARESVKERIQGLDTGADDYLSKPFAIPELLSRIRAVVRRSAGFASQSWQLGPVTLLPEARQVLLEGVPVNLAPREYAILSLLMRNPGRVLTRTQLEEELLEDCEGFESNTLEVHVHHLRKKLGTALIRTVRGVGYMVQG